MSVYEAPVRDIMFVLNHIAGLAEVGALPGCSDVSAELAESVLSEAARFARDVLDPLNGPGDREGAHFSGGTVTSPSGFRNAYRAFTAAGWNSIGSDPAYGGQGLPQVVATAVQEIWNGANMAFCLAPMLTSGVIETLSRHASDEQRATYLPHLVSGRWTGTMNLTEPQAGSDLSAVETTATRRGDHYLIRGTKMFITWGEHDLTENIVHLVLARVPGAPEGVKGISLFIVPSRLPHADGDRTERNDVGCISIERKMGIHASPTCLMRYGETTGAIGYLEGQENRGLEYMFTMMNHARIAVGVEGVGIAERAWQHARAYARERLQGRPVGSRSGPRVPIVRHPDVRRMLWSMRSRIEAMRGLACWTAAALDKAKRHPDPGARQRQQRFVDIMTPVVKAWCTDQAVDIASTGMQVHGGLGYIEDTGAAQYLRDARITTIYEGTNGIQANDLAGRKVIADGGETARELLADMKATAAAGPVPDGMAALLAEAFFALEAATTHIVTTASADPEGAAAVAVPYLDLFGTTVAGWLMLRGASHASAALAGGAEDTAYFEGRIASARFFFKHFLVRAAVLSRIVIAGGECVSGASIDLL